MQYNKKTLTTLLAATLLSTTLSALDLQGLAELKYGIADGKAKSYLNTASNTTHAAHLSMGAYLPEYNTRAMLNYKPIRWEDADADLISLSVDYLYRANQNLDLFAGAGIGSMSFEAQNMKDTKTVYTLQIGLNYTLSKQFYTTANINSIYTNDLGVYKNQYTYAELEDLLGLEVGIGYSF